MEGDNGNGEPVEIITPASYYLKNGKHYVLYDEVVEGVPGKIKIQLKLQTAICLKSVNPALQIPTWYLNGENEYDIL